MSLLSVTDELARFVSSTQSGEVPAAAREAARHSILDTLGVALAGSATATSRAVVAGFAVPADRAAAVGTVIGREHRLTATDAAYANGVAAHALDYDDTQSDVRGHPSATVLPAALAAAECAGQSGTALVESYLVGVEVAARVGRGLGASHARQGFHSTGTLGVLGAAAAAARGLGLDVRQTRAALGIAASSAAGLRSNFGTMTKPLHAGHAARDGLEAAVLALRGVTAHPDALSGFVTTFCPGGDGDLEALREAGQPWLAVEPGLAIKKYPCCNRGHRAADALLGLVQEHRVHANDVRQIEVRMPAGQVDDHGNVGPMTFPRPATGLEAKFSMPYVVAAAVVDRGLRLSAFTDDGVRRGDVCSLVERVQVCNRDDTDDVVEVVVNMADGGRLARRTRFPRGDPRGGQPLRWDELVAKFTDCAATVLDPAGARAVVEQVAHLDELAHVAELAGLLR